MAFRISGLSPEPFRPLFGLSDDALAEKGVRRIVAEPGQSMPDRIALRDARPGEAVLLLNYVHQPADTPFRAAHAIFVLEHAAATKVSENELPPALATRLLSLRAFDADDMMIAADIGEGEGAVGLIEAMLGDPAVAYLHAHYAKWGCYAARVDRI